MSTPIFKLINFSPVGFRQPNYPTSYCSLCRGYLSDICHTCNDNNIDTCLIIENDHSFYHKHCFDFMKDTKKK